MRHSPRLASLLVILLFAVRLDVSDTWAQEPHERAAELYRMGVEAFLREDFPAAARHYAESLRQSPTYEAAANLCNLLIYGMGVERDYQAAHQLCSLAANGDEPNALTMMGEIHLFGYGVPRDFQLALSFYRRAAELGHVHGQYMLGSLLLEETETVDDGIEWLRSAAEAGHEGALERLRNISDDFAD